MFLPECLTLSYVETDFAGLLEFTDRQILITRVYAQEMWAFGFATGTVTGITLERWIGSGTVLVRVISRNHAIRLKEHLHSEHFGVTAVQGQGYEGNVLVMFVVAPRRREHDVLAAVRHVDPDAFITVEPVNQAYGGFPVTSVAPSPSALKK